MAVSTNFVKMICIEMDMLFDDQSTCCLNFDTGHCGSQGSFHK